LIVHRGKRYRLAFHNGMEDGHPIHLHRHSFELVSVAGKPTAGIIKDTVNLPRNTTIEIDFVADNPDLRCCIATCNSTWITDSRPS
jgi:FtsP/CotA-like multicopper oxidase with cupredoxin domain